MKISSASASPPLPVHHESVPSVAANAVKPDSLFASHGVRLPQTASSPRMPPRRSPPHRQRLHHSAAGNQGGPIDEECPPPQVDDLHRIHSYGTLRIGGTDTGPGHEEGRPDGRTGPHRGLQARVPPGTRAPMTSLDEWLARAQWPGFTELRIGGSEEHGFNRRRAMALTDALLASLDADTRGIGPGVSVQAIQMALVQAYLQTFPDDNPLPTLEQVKRMLMERTATLKPAPASSEAAQNRCALLPLMLLNATWSRTLGQRLQACDRLSLLQRSRPALPSP